MIPREEYRLAMEALEGEKYLRGAVVLGQPGIGKTFFLIYALIERLRKKQSTAFQYFPDVYLLFTETGVTAYATNDAEPLVSRHGIWALADSNADTIQPADAFRRPKIRTIQAASPDTKRWKEWRKQHKARVYIMDNWTKGELSALATLSGLDIERMLNLAEQWGPSPRPLLEIGSDEEIESGFQQHIDASASDFVWNARQVMSSLRLLDLPLGKTGPSSLIFIRPRRDESKRVYRTQCEVYVPTTTIKHSIARALLKQDVAIRTQFFSATSSHAAMRSTAGYIFEQWVHARFLSGDDVDCTWLNTDSCNSASLPSTLAIPQPLQLISTNVELKTRSPPFYWHPVSINFPGIDGLLCLGNDVYAIQCTMSERHRSPLKGLRTLQKIIGEQCGLSWRVLFIGESERQATAAAKPHITLTEDEEDEDSSKKKKGAKDDITSTEGEGSSKEKKKKDAKPHITSTEDEDSSRKRKMETKDTKPHITPTQGEGSSGKRKRETKYIPVGVCALPITPECHKEEWLHKSLERMVCGTMTFICGVA
ncbi:hypothetical protein BU15DRAFT_50502 [Melanogaster broomeanus]|nr:hypothetical protein BU15DRAFT_50502 [Melanogaster broomeanus]